MVNFPSSFDDDTTLYVAVNNLRTRLTAGITAGDTTIPVLTTSGYPDSGYISILTGGDITKTEAIYYPATTSTTFSGVTRGASGTTAYPHNINDNVDLTIVADHHNELKNAIINLEHFVGVSGAENFLPLDDAGNAVVPGDLGVGGALSVQDSVVVSGGATFYFATITGSLDVGGDASFQGDVTAVGTISGSNVKTPTAELDTLTVNQESTVSGTPVMVGLPDSISLANITVSNTGTFGQSLTISGSPVMVDLPDTINPTTVNATNVYVSTSLTISGIPVPLEGAPAVVPDPLTLASGIFTDQLTISGEPVATGVGGGGGTTDHSALSNLDYASSGHTGFASEAQLVSTSGHLQDQIPTFYPTATTPASSGSGRWDPFMPPAVSDSLDLDDEFEGTLDASLTDSTKWTVFNPGLVNVSPGSPVPVNKTNPKRMSFDFGTIQDDFVGMHQVASTGTASHHLITHMCINDLVGDWGGWPTDHWGGFMVFEDAAASGTTNFLFFGVNVLVNGGSPSAATDIEWRLGGWEFSSYTDTSPTQLNSVLQQTQDHAFAGGVFLRIKYDIDTVDAPTFRVDWSRDGRAWNTFLDFDLVDATMSDFNAIGIGAARRAGYVDSVDFSFYRAFSAGTIHGVGEMLPAGELGAVPEVLTTTSGSFSQSLTVSGIPVSTGTGGGSASTLQDAYDNGDGVIITETDKPLALSGTGELVAATGTFTDGITVGSASTFIGEDVVTANSVEVANSLTVSGAPVASGTSLYVAGHYYLPDAPPAYPHPQSDFFDQEPLSSPNLYLVRSYIDTNKWTLWDPSTNSGTRHGFRDLIAEGVAGPPYTTNTVMQIEHSGSTQNTWVGWVQDVPSGNFTITAKLGGYTFSIGSDYRVGIFIAEDILGAGNKIYSCQIHHIDTQYYDAGDYSQYQSTLWDNQSTPVSHNSTSPGAFPGTSGWVRIAYRSSDGRVDAAISSDGYIWGELERIASLSFTPVKMGFGMWNDNGMSNTPAMIQFFAVNDRFNREGSRGHGRLVPILLPSNGGLR